MSEFKLSSARYGKDIVRVFRVIKPSIPGGQHQVVEYNVCLLLEGDIETRYAMSLFGAYHVIGQPFPCNLLSIAHLPRRNNN